MLSRDPVFWAAFAYAVVSMVHPPAPIRALNALAILFFPIYARKLRIPEKHPKKVIGYYVLCLQLLWTNISFASESFVVVTIYWQARRSLRKLSNNTNTSNQIQTTPSESDVDEKSATQNEGSSSITIPEPTSTPQLDPTKPQFSIKSWPFKIAAGLTIFGYLLALVDSYYSNYNDSFPRDSRMYRQQWTSYDTRGFMSQVYFSLALMAVQAYVMLLPGSFQRAYASLMASFQKRTVVVFMTLPNAAIYSLALLTINTTPYRYIHLLWDMFFWTGPHFAFVLVLVWHLHHTCLLFEQSSSTTINAASEECGVQEVHAVQNHNIDQTEGGAVAAAEKDTKDNKHSPVPAVEDESFRAEEQGIDISDLSTPSTFMVHIPDMGNYEHLQDK